MVDIPVDDENPLQTMLLARVVSRERDVAKEAESHRPIVDGVVPRRADSGETARMHASDGEVDRGKHTASASCCGFPRASALHCVRVQTSTALFRQHADGADVRGVVDQLQLFNCRVTALDVLDAVE